MMVSESLANRVFNAVNASITEARRWPLCTYRLQFNRTFTFRDAARVAAYLHELGVTDCYASPYLKARPGSLHGYDISDHNTINPEIGSVKDYRSFIGQLHKNGMAQLLDFVPNHMGIFDNPWWQDVLENGPSSAYARFFDIDWDPVKAELRDKVLLPILEDLYGKVLGAGELRLAFDHGTFKILYHNNALPVDPKTAVMVLQQCLDHVRKAEGRETQDTLELQSIITACNNLPGRNETDKERAAERQREKEIVKKRLWTLYSSRRRLRGCLDETIHEFNGGTRAGAKFDQLHQLLEGQVYRLSYWRVAAEEINYRRFFDINELAALRMEAPSCFEESHRLLRQLLCDGEVTGVRIDHVDGLFNPRGYLGQLQLGYFLDICWKTEVQGRLFLSPTEASELREKLAERWTQECARDPSSAVARPLYVVVEKILTGGEDLRGNWPVYGTTGYDFTPVLNGVFVDGRSEQSLLSTYRQFTGTDTEFADIVYRAKSLVMRTSMAAELNVLAHQLNRLSERSRWYRDFTLNSLRDALREVIACFPVYRTYIEETNGSLDERDEAIIKRAVLEARRRNPTISAAVFDFLRDTLLLQYPADMSEEGRREQRLFVMHFQQLTGPIMAKGTEDTAFYIYNPLVSLNDVGGNPQSFGTTIEEFHKQNQRRRKAMPHSLITTSTHDSKRSEDVRARINVLSEMPKQWRSALTRWTRLNRKHKTSSNGLEVPDRNEECLLYQTLVGTYPLQEMDDKQRAAYCKRLHDYMLKAIREAKVHTSWVNPNVPYEEAVRAFISSILNPSVSPSFLKSFEQLCAVATTCGMYNSLAQVVLKAFSPGVPDTYQGNELWQFSLVDPDNRQPVDFQVRSRVLGSLKLQSSSAADQPRLATRLCESINDGYIKLYVTWKSLSYRRDHADLFSSGTYMPLYATGAKEAHICAFAWEKNQAELLVVVPRLMFGLVGENCRPPLRSQIWEDSMLVLPKKRPGHEYRNIFTGETLTAVARAGENVMALGELFSTFPVAVLERSTPTASVGPRKR